MALDGLYLHTLKNEMESTVLGSRIDKIYQPSKEEIVLVLRGKGPTKRLLLSAGANSPRIHFTDGELENPKVPPMFCMLLRKHLSGGRLLAVRQLSLDRVLYLDFDVADELGDRKTITVSCEIMGRHSNIIIIDQDGKVLDAIKRVDREMSGVRPMLPGVVYTPPPAQQKINLFTASSEDVKSAILSAKGSDLSKSIGNALEGFSSTLAREVVYRAFKTVDMDKNALSSDQWDRLLFSLFKVRDAAEDPGDGLSILYENGEKPKEFSFIPLTQYGALLLEKRLSSPSELLDRFYSERVRVERMKQRSGDLLKLLINATDRVSRKIANQKEELKDCANREQLKEYGDLLSAHLYRMEKGMTAVTLEDFYHDNQPVSIPLNPALTPVQNAQRYYKEYHKAATAEKMLQKLIKEGEEELLYLDSVFDAVSRTSGESELLEIRQELSEQGYLKRYKTQNKMIKGKPPIPYRSSDGYRILCGRNNKQNDTLTLRTAGKEDIWFHTQGFAGSHVILFTEGKTLNELPDRTVEEAAMIAAYHSKARAAALVPVDYTEVKNIKKPQGAKPGMVIFDKYYTLYTTPEEEEVSSLAAEK